MPSRNRRADHNIRTLRDRHECLSFCICYNTNHGFFFSTPSSESLAGIGLVFWVVLAACYWTFELDLISPTGTWDAVKVLNTLIFFSFLSLINLSCLQEALLKPYTLDAEASWAVCSIFNNGSDLLYSRLNRSHSFKWTIAFTSATNKIDETPSLLTLG